MNTTDHFILHDASSNLMAFQTTLLSRLQSKWIPVSLRRDIGLSNTGEIRALMINSGLWRAAIRDSRVGVG